MRAMIRAVPSTQATTRKAQYSKGRACVGAWTKNAYETVSKSAIGTIVAATVVRRIVVAGDGP